MSVSTTIDQIGGKRKNFEARSATSKTNDNIVASSYHSIWDPELETVIEV